MKITEFDGELPIIASTRPNRNGETTSSEGLIDSLLLAPEYDAVEAILLDLASARVSEQLLYAADTLSTKVIVSYHNFVETPEREAFLKTVADAAAVF